MPHVFYLQVDANHSLLAQEYSLGPFPIPERLLRKILTRYAVAPLFLDVLRGVSNETRISEESYGNAFYRASRKSQTNIEISYQLKYADHARYDPNFPWQIRQTEVFHRMTVDKGHPQNFWLVFQPVINSRFEKSLQEKVGDEDKWRSLETNPIRQHVMLISAYVDNWREYLASIGKEYQYHVSFLPVYAEILGKVELIRRSGEGSRLYNLQGMRTSTASSTSKACRSSAR